MITWRMATLSLESTILSDPNTTVSWHTVLWTRTTAKPGWFCNSERAESLPSGTTLLMNMCMALVIPEKIHGLDCVRCATSSMLVTKWSFDWKLEEIGVRIKTSTMSEHGDLRQVWIVQASEVLVVVNCFRSSPSTATSLCEFPRFSMGISLIQYRTSPLPMVSPSMRFVLMSLKILVAWHVSA